MQTFLPYPSFAESAACLDRQRLGKQRVECLQIMKVLAGKTKGWRNHPAVKMWQGYEFALSFYAHVICDEWRRRGYKDTCDQKISDLYVAMSIPKSGSNYNSPAWLGDPAFHAAHRSNLLRKDSAHYGQFGWSEPATLPYVWPV